MAFKYTPQQLSAVSAILARSAALTDWEGSGKEGGKVEEIQCMVFEGRLYIAGNHAEAARVLALLNAFGVKGKGTFEKCLSYCHWLLTVPSQERAEKVGQAYGHKLSDQEQSALALSGEDGPHYEIPIQDKAAAKALVLATEVTGDARTQALQSFLRKFVGLDPLVERKGTRNRSGVGIALIKDVSSAVTDINVLSDARQVHAELKLLAHAYRCVSARGAGQVTVSLGGLKKACSNCAEWIKGFHLLPTKRTAANPKVDKSAITAQSPTPDPRGTGSGAGLRPECDTTGDVPLAQRLFNGGANSSSSDLQ